MTFLQKYKTFLVQLLILFISLVITLNLTAGHLVDGCCIWETKTLDKNKRIISPPIACGCPVPPDIENINGWFAQTLNLFDIDYYLYQAGAQPRSFSVTVLPPMHFPKDINIIVIFLTLVIMINLAMLVTKSTRTLLAGDKLESHDIRLILRFAFLIIFMLSLVVILVNLYV